MTENTTIAYIAVGSNLADRRRNILNALALMNAEDGISLIRTSSIYPSKPLSGGSQDEYLNGVVEIETDLPAVKLLERLKKIETEMGRTSQDKWQSRIIDLDIIFYGEQIIEKPHLRIPHSQAHLRSFVLEGVCQLAPEKIHPLLKRSCRRLYDRLGGGNYFIDTSKPLLIETSGAIGVGKTTLAQGLTKMFNGTLLKERYDKNPYLPLVYEGRQDLTLDCELFFLGNSLSELKEANLAPSQVYIADYIFEKSAIYPRFWLKEEDFRVFNERYQQAKEQVARPMLVIDIYDSPENCLERIQKRAREYEQDISLDFIKCLADEYEKILSGGKKSPIIRLNAAEYDFRKTDCVKEIFEEVKHYVLPS